MKRGIAVLLALLLLCGAAVSFAEEGRTVTVNLDTASDEELAEAAARIKAEQRARLKTTIRIEPAEVSVDIGASVKLTASVQDLPEGVAEGAYTWTSSDESVAAMAKNTLKGIAGGTAVITCANVLSDGTEIRQDMTVTVTVPVKGVRVGQNRIEVMAGETFEQEVTVSPEDASDKTYTLQSANENVVTVLEDGRLKAVKAGSAAVTVTTASGRKKAQFTVVVKRRIGKSFDSLDYPGLEWGCGAETAVGSARLEHAGKTFPRWPEDDMLFAFKRWDELPKVFRDADCGTWKYTFSPAEELNGHLPAETTLYFLNPVGEDGQVDRETTELAAVSVSFNSERERGAEIFVDLLAKLEAQYGEFSRYMRRDFAGKYYKKTYDVIKGAMKDAIRYEFDTFGKEQSLLIRAICTMHGADQTGIMLMLDTEENVTLLYMKKDSGQLLDRLAAALK